MSEVVGNETGLAGFTELELTEAELYNAADRWVEARNAASRDDHMNAELNLRQDHAMMRVDYLLDELFDRMIENTDGQTSSEA